MTPVQLAIIAQDLTEAQVFAAAIVAAIGTFFTGIAAALYGPFISDWWARKKLRRDLYRELVNWYETAQFHIRSHDLASRDAFFKPWYPEVEPESPSKMTHVRVGSSIIQAEEDQQIWRIGLIEKLVRLKDIFDVLNADLLNDSLYAKALANENNLQLFYQLPESYDLAQCYENFRSAFEFGVTRYDFVPHSRFLALKEARKLSVLEAKLDYLKIACLTVEKSADTGGLDGSLLQKMRRGQESGTMIRSIGTVTKKEWLPDCGRYDKLVAIRSSGHPLRWCLHCKKYREPVVYWKPIKQFRNELCGYCGNVLPTIDELSKQLSSKRDDKREKAADALAKNYAYNRTGQLEEGNIKCLIDRLRKDRSRSVQLSAAIALKNLGWRLKKVKAEEEQGVDKDLRVPVVRALVNFLNRYPSSNQGVRKTAIEAIGQVLSGSKNHVPVHVRSKLRKLLRKGSNDEKRAAASAIGFIGAKKLLPDLLNLLPSLYRPNYAESSSTSDSQERDENLLITIIKSLGCFRYESVGGEKPVDCLIAVLQRKEEDPKVRKWAAYILAAIGAVDEVKGPLTKVANEELEKPHDDEHYELRIAARRALNWLSPSTKSLSFKDKKVRVRLIEKNRG